MISPENRVDLLIENIEQQCLIEKSHKDAEYHDHQADNEKPASPEIIVLHQIIPWIFPQRKLDLRLHSNHWDSACECANVFLVLPDLISNQFAEIFDRVGMVFLVILKDLLTILGR